MFTHILVPLDGSQLAEAGLPLTQSLAARLHARVTLLHIAERHAPATVHGEHHLRDAREAEAYLRALAEQSSPRGAMAWHVHEDQPQGVAAMIVDQADELRADLIVLSTHGSGGLREKLLGSIAQQVIHAGRVPVLLLRPPKETAHTPRAIKHILLPLDGEQAHEVAVPAAAALADALDARIHLLSVVPTIETLSAEESAAGLVLPSAMRAVLEFAEQGGASYLQQVQAQLGRDVSAAIARGDPAKSIVKVARQVEADLIIMATHGRKGLGAFWSASVTPKVLSEFTGPLLLLRARDER